MSPLGGQVTITGTLLLGDELLHMKNYFWAIICCLLLCVTGCTVLFSKSAFLQQVIGITSVLLLSMYIAYLVVKRSDLIIKAQRNQILRLQLNPHFLFNSFCSLSDFIQQKDFQNADLYLSKFAKLMRRTLENSNCELISLAEELSNLELYLQLENSRLGDRFIYQIMIDDSLDTSRIMVPPMILQPFVENSIWHGISHVKQGKIVVNISQTGKQLEYQIYNNGPGYFPNSCKTDQKKKSLGMKITKERIRASYQSLFQPRNLFRWQNLSGGTLFAVKIPYLNETDL